MEVWHEQELAERTLRNMVLFYLNLSEHTCWFQTSTSQTETELWVTFTIMTNTDVLDWAGPEELQAVYRLFCSDVHLLRTLVKCVFYSSEIICIEENKNL